MLSYMWNVRSATHTYFDAREKEREENWGWTNKNCVGSSNSVHHSFQVLPFAANLKIQSKSLKLI